MKPWPTTVISALLLFSGVLGGCVSNPTAPTGDQGAAIEEVIDQVQQALADVQTTLAAKAFPALKDVKLTLQTVATRKAGGTLKLWVVSAGETVEKGRTQQIVVTLVPPPAGHPKLMAGESLTGDLEGAIFSAAEGVQKAAAGKVPLVASAVDVEINFTVKSTGSGGANVVLAPVTASLSGDFTTTSLQSIKVSFATR